jgi:hypothetical protein
MCFIITNIIIVAIIIYNKNILFQIPAIYQEDLVISAQLKAGALGVLFWS